MRPPACGGAENWGIVWDSLLNTTPKETRGLSTKEERLATAKSSKLQEESELFQELWSKFRWSLGSTLKVTYTKRSSVGDIARMMARSCSSLEYQTYLEGGHAYRVAIARNERQERALMRHEPERARNLKEINEICGID
jgi:hypothetical protein